MSKIIIDFFFKNQAKWDVPKDNKESNEQIVSFGYIVGKPIAQVNRNGPNQWMTYVLFHNLGYLL